MIFVDGVDIGDPADVALRDRRMLSDDGIFIVVATISEQTGESVVDPEVIFRGVPFVEQADGLLHDIRGEVEQSLRRAVGDGIREIDLLQQELHDDLATFVYDRLRRRPMVLPGRRRGVSRRSSRAAAPRRSGSVTTNRRPVEPSAVGSSATEPPCDWATALTIARPSPEPPRPGGAAIARRRGRSARRSDRRARSGIPGPSSSTTSSACAVAESRWTRAHCVPGGVCLTAFSIRFSTSRCRSSRAPDTTAGRASICSS